MSHRMKMNQHIITMASPPRDDKLFKRHCSGAFLAPQQAGGITGGNACSRCCACKGLSINGHGYTRLRIRHPVPAAEQSSELENATNQPGGVSDLTISLAVE
jgi:hypothetical protein